MKSGKKKKFIQDTEYRIYRILHLAKKYGWTLTKNDGHKFEFTDKQKAILHINYYNLKVATAIDHPKWGNTVLQRSGELTEKIIESIFRNPRAHMPKNVKSEYVNNSFS